MSVLLVFPNPRGTDPRRLDKEERALRGSIQLAKHRDRFDIEALHAATIDDLRRALIARQRTIVHISGQGADDGLRFEDEAGDVLVPDMAALGKLLQRRGVETVILNACSSLSALGTARMGTRYTVAMEGSVDDGGAIEFSRGFYDVLGARGDVEEAYEEGLSCAEIKRRPVKAVLLGNVVERAREIEVHPHPSVAAVASAGAAWREPLTGMSFVWVPPGRFVMGSSKEPGTAGFDPEAYDADTPAHEVELPDGVWMAEHPVTNAAYGVFLAEKTHPEPAFRQNRRFNAAEQPVVGVSFENALAFCTWLTARVRLQDDHRFDLPTEAEWEHAARGSDGRRYPWGNESPTPERACFGQPWDSGAPAPVCGRPAGKSPFGCQDMAGNVWEWCLDAWREGYDGKVTTSVNPCHPGDRGSPRVVRGGSWFNLPRDLRCAIRSRCVPGDRSQFLGFRVVRRGSRQPWLVGS